MHIDAAVGHGFGETRKAIEPVRVHAVACGLCKEASTVGRATAFKTKAQHGAVESREKIVVRNSEHEISVGRDCRYFPDLKFAAASFECSNAMAECS